MASSDEAEDEMDHGDDPADRACFPSGIPLHVQVRTGSSGSGSKRRAGRASMFGGGQSHDGSDQEQDERDTHDNDDDDVDDEEDDDLWWDPFDEWHQSHGRVGEAAEKDRHDDDEDVDDLSSTTFYSLDDSSVELQPMTTTAQGCYQRAVFWLAAAVTTSANTTTALAAGPAQPFRHPTSLAVAMSPPLLSSSSPSVRNDDDDDEDYHQILQDILHLCRKGLTLMKTTKRSVETKPGEEEEDDDDDEEEVNSLLKEESDNDNHTDVAAVAAAVVAKEDETSVTESLYWKLVQLKAQVLGRLGHYQESLHDYEELLQLLQQSQGGPASSPRNDNSTKVLPAAQALAVQANLLYACGRLSAYQKEYDRAIAYYQHELEVTRALLQQTNAAALEPAPAPPAEPLQHASLHPTNTSLAWLGTMTSTTATTSMLALSRIHHELARLHKVARGDGSRALKHYEQALQVELSVYQQLTRAAPFLTPLVNCTKRQQNRNLQTKHGSRSLPGRGGGGGQRRGSCCCSCARCTDLLETAQQIRETKRAMGRIHFELGDFDKAVKLSL